MSGAASISGLASGLDTATIIDQLMQLEAVPQTRLRSRVSSEQLAVNAMQTLNAQARRHSPPRPPTSRKPTAWAPLTRHLLQRPGRQRSPPTTGAAPTSLRGPGRPDRAQPTGSSSPPPPTSTPPATVPTTVRLDRLDGTTPVDLTTDGTLQGLVDAINDPANARPACARPPSRSATDQYRLLVESTDDRARPATSPSPTPADGSALLGGATVRAGRDAQVTLGDSIVATSTTNTFADLVPGVDAHPRRPTPPASSDIALTRDTSDRLRASRASSTRSTPC